MRIYWIYFETMLFEIGNIWILFDFEWAAGFWIWKSTRKSKTRFFDHHKTKSSSMKRRLSSYFIAKSHRRHHISANGSLVNFPHFALRFEFYGVFCGFAIDSWNYMLCGIFSQLGLRANQVGLHEERWSNERRKDVSRVKKYHPVSRDGSVVFTAVQYCGHFLWVFAIKTRNFNYFLLLKNFQLIFTDSPQPTRNKREHTNWLIIIEV